jgi:cytochrome c oxidase subunit 1
VALFRGEKAPPDPWGGVTFEWTLPSPPPEENFEELPAFGGNPYPFPLEARR